MNRPSGAVDFDAAATRGAVGKRHSCDDRATSQNHRCRCHGSCCGSRDDSRGGHRRGDPTANYHRTGGRLAHLLLVRDYLPECDAAALCRRIQQVSPKKKKRFEEEIRARACPAADNNQSSSRRIRMPWWANPVADGGLGDIVDPITLEPLAASDAAPFELPASPPLKTTSDWFDARALAAYLVARGCFVHPISRREISAADCARLDAHLRALGERRICVAAAYEDQSRPNSGTGSAPEAAAHLQALAASLAASLFDPGPPSRPGAARGAHRGAGRPPRQAPPPAAPADFGRRRPLRQRREQLAAQRGAAVRTDGGLSIVDDDLVPSQSTGGGWEAAAAAATSAVVGRPRDAAAEAFPALPALAPASAEAAPSLAAATAARRAAEAAAAEEAEAAARAADEARLAEISSGRALARRARLDELQATHLSRLRHEAAEAAGAAAGAAAEDAAEDAEAEAEAEEGLVRAVVVAVVRRAVFGAREAAVEARLAAAASLSAAAELAANEHRLAREAYREKGGRGESIRGAATRSRECEGRGGTQEEET